MNRYVRDASDDGTAEEALRDFRRFPAWMWRNTDVVDFIEWLREWNESRPSGEARAGFYGLDLYSLHTSMEAVVAYLDRVDPEAAQRARERYSCFDHFGPDPQVYAYVAAQNRARRRSSSSLSSSGTGPPSSRAATGASTPTASSTPSRTRVLS
jgi:erythromycin esterase-like protein